MGALFATFGINAKLLLAQAINFGLLLGILWYFLYKPLLAIIDKRRETVAEGVRKAEAAQKRLDDAKQEGDQMVGSAAREAEGIVAAARTRADERASEIMTNAQQRADGMMKETEARAEELKRQVMRESEKEIARAAMLAAEKLLHEKSA